MLKNTARRTTTETKRISSPEIGRGRRRLLSIMVAACLPAVAGAETAGTVTFSKGAAEVVYANGDRASLSRGMRLSENDTVRTGVSGLTQVRFTDGAYISIQRNTVFKIDEYAYSGQNEPAQDTNKGFFSLVTGGFRAITGFLGVKNYRVKTPVATIGIRGTEYFAEYGRSLTFNVADGAIEVCNTAGCQFFRENEFGNIEDNAALIQRLRDLGLDVLVSAATGDTAASIEGGEDFVYRISEDVDEDGEPVLLQGNALNCTSMNCVAAFGWVDTGGGFGSDSTSALSATFVNGALVSHDGGSLASPDALGSASAQVAGTTSNLTWGRWTGGTSEAGFDEVHYVVGIPTPDIGNLSGTASFSVAGWTTPTTTVMGLGAFNGITGNLYADFDYSQVDMNFTVDYANHDYQLYTSSAIAIMSDSTFYGPVGAGGGIPTGSGPSCSAFGCSAAVSGFFAGANASNAGLSYHLNDPSAGKLTGAVVFDNNVGELIDTGGKL